MGSLRQGTQGGWGDSVGRRSGRGAHPATADSSSSRRKAHRDPLGMTGRGRDSESRGRPKGRAYICRKAAELRRRREALRYKNDSVGRRSGRGHARQLQIPCRMLVASSLGMTGRGCDSESRPPRAGRRGRLKGRAYICRKAAELRRRREALRYKGNRRFPPRQASLVALHALKTALAG
jgi:hypothetical protein